MRPTAVLLLLAPLLGAAQEPASARPNLLWITCEDISPNLRCFGDDYAVTPNLDRLAAQGVRYARAYAPIGVCAPSRSTLILGVMATSVGSHLMRCKATLPDEVRCFPEYLRRSGYHCTNNVKTDYNFAAPETSWDESSAKAHWRNRKPGQPFFAVFNLTSCHESQIRISDGAHRARVEKIGAAHDPAKALVPPYHPDVPDARQDWARYADAITLMDKQVGEVLAQLEADGLAKDTIVIYFSDHGAGMPRSKRWLYESSLRVPMIARFPERWAKWAPGAPGSTSDRLVAFTDLGPTMLNLAGVPVPPAMQGKPFLGENAAPPREYVHGFRDRMDERVDLLRTVRDARFRYIRNYMPHRPWAQHVSYMYEMPTMKAWQRLHDEGKLEGPQKTFFQEKPFEELYDSEADPHEVRNLAADPAHAGTLARLRKELDRWMLEIRDLGFLPEADLRSRWGKAAPWKAVREKPESYPLERLMEAAATSAARDVAKLPDLVALLGESDPALRYWGATGLLALGAKSAPAEDALRKALADSSPSVRLAAAEALAGLGRSDEALEVARRDLREGNDFVQHHAALVLDALGPKAAPAIGDLRAVAAGKYEYSKRVAEHVLKKLAK
jgi:arylsulfatase A-like enzyme